MALTAMTVIGLGFSARVRAGDIFHRAIPRETLAMDYRTGGVMMAPPIPYGEYAKDYAGAVHGAMGLPMGAVHGLAGHAHGLANAMHNLCGKCGGKGLFNGHGCDGCGGDGCTSCGGDVISEGGHGHGHGGGLFHGGMGGLFGHKNGAGNDSYVPTVNTLVASGNGHGHGHGEGVACVGPGCTTGYASSQSAPTVPVKASGQMLAGSPQSIGVCGGCHGAGKISNGGGCGLCGGSGKIKSLFGKFCGNCHGRGCGGCGGSGLLSHGDSACGSCGGKGCGLCKGGKLCGACGGRGCGLCGHLAGLKGKALGLGAKLLHKGQIKYFVGAGGPVPITPGYVPYVVTTRSPRDFFAFPPFSEQVP